MNKRLFICVIWYFVAEIHGSDPDYVYLVPSKEWESCPEGDSIPCGEVVNTNNTVLRYERLNSTVSSKPVPSEDCRWIIQAPSGTKVFLETTCYHHYHINYTDEYRTCTSILIDHPNWTETKLCGNGYLVQGLVQSNLANFTVYYKDGMPRDLGFTVKITFIGEELPTATPSVISTSQPESTTSNVESNKINLIFLLLGLFVTFSLHVYA
ncbi:uncharacterized protein LOC120329089 [Styela clava]